MLADSLPNAAWSTEGIICSRWSLCPEAWSCRQNTQTLPGWLSIGLPIRCSSAEIHTICQELSINVEGLATAQPLNNYPQGDSWVELQIMGNSDRESKPHFAHSIHEELKQPIPTPTGVCRPPFRTLVTSSPGICPSCTSTNVGKVSRSDRM